jgi:hypothetical protein
VSLGPTGRLAPFRLHFEWAGGRLPAEAIERGS